MLGAPIYREKAQQGAPLYGPDMPIYRVGPQLGGGGSLYVYDMPNNREGPQARQLSKSLNGQSYIEKTSQRDLTASYQRLEKNTLIKP